MYRGAKEAGGEKGEQLPCELNGNALVMSWMRYFREGAPHLSSRLGGE